MPSGLRTTLCDIHYSLLLRRSALSGEDLRDHVPVDVRQSEISALVAEGQALVVDAAKLEHGGVEVVDVADVFDGAVAQFVGGAVDGAGLDAAAGEEDGKGEDVVVAAGALAHGSAAELAA